MKIFKTILLVLTYSTVNAQFNYVPNPSFEIIDTCVNFADNIWVAAPWDTLQNDSSGIAEVIYNCGNYSPIPNSSLAYQFPRTGNSHMQTYVYNESNQIFYQRDYPQVKLRETLINEHSYCVTFYVNLQNYSKIAIDSIGAYFDDGSISTVSFMSFAYAIPQVASIYGNYLSDTANWMKVQGNFIATGNETYMTIGNFRSNQQTDTLHLADLTNNTSPEIVYYFFDDISVVESNSIAYAGPDTSIVFGDSLELGKNYTLGLPCQWFTLSGALLGTGSTAFVKPTVTSKFVMKLELYNNTSYDTITVFVTPNSIIENKYSNKISVFPNPANDVLNITINSLNDNTLYVINILDLVGRFCNSYQVKKNDVIDISNLSEGLYFIEVEKDKIIERQKFSIIK